MDTEAIAVRKRGRSASETPAQRIERLQRELTAARADAKKSERERAAIVGAAVLAEVETNPSFKGAVLDVLKRRVKSATDKADIAAILADG